MDIRRVGGLPRLLNLGAVVVLIAAGNATQSRVTAVQANSALASTASTPYEEQSSRDV